MVAVGDARRCFTTRAAQRQRSRRHQRLRAERWIFRYRDAATTRCCGRRTGSATVLEDAGGEARQRRRTPSTPSGQSVGISYTNRERSATRCCGRRRGPRRCFKDAGGQGFSDAVAINALRAERRIFRRPRGGQDAVLWSATGTATVLQDAGGQGFSGAVAINAAGQSVGFSETATRPGRGAVVVDGDGDGASGRWRPGLQRAVAINDSGRERRIFRHRERRRGGAMVVVGDGDEPWRHAGASLERYPSRGDQQCRRHYRVWRI